MCTKRANCNEENRLNENRFADNIIVLSHVCVHFFVSILFCERFLVSFDENKNAKQLMDKKNKKQSKALWNKKKERERRWRNVHDMTINPIGVHSVSFDNFNRKKYPIYLPSEETKETKPQLLMAITFLYFMLGVCVYVCTFGLLVLTNGNQLLLFLLCLIVFLFVSSVFAIALSTTATKSNSNANHQRWSYYFYFTYFTDYQLEHWSFEWIRQF